MDVEMAPLRPLAAARAAIGSANGRTVLLTAVMAVIGATLTFRAPHFAVLSHRVTLRWWELVPASIAADELGFNLEVRGEAQTFTLSELPLVLGFFFAPLWAVVLARLIGGMLHQVLRRRQYGIKLWFNLSLWVFETSVAMVVFRAVDASRPPTDTVSWGMVLASVALADLLSVVAVSWVIRWHGGLPRWPSTATTWGLTATINANLGLLAAFVLWEQAAGLVLVGVVLMMTSLAYRGYTSLARRYASLKLLYEFTKVRGDHPSAGESIDRMLVKARELLAAEVAEVVLFDRVTGLPELRRRTTAAGSAGPASFEEPSAAVAWTAVVDGHQAGFVVRGQVQGGLAALRDQLGVRDLMAAPLHVEGVTIGVLVVANRFGDRTTFEAEDCRLFETLANHASVMFENTRLVQQLRSEAERRHREALHDSLTGLANRAYFAQQVDAAITATGSATVMLMDLDRFKEVNDTLGHHTGDLLLGEVANRLVSTIRPGDSAARLGGDEFAVLLTGEVGIATGDLVADEVLEALRRPFLVDGLSLHVGCSLGIARGPVHGGDAASLLQRADVAMYVAKGNGGGRVGYTIELDTHSTRRLALAGELRQAIDDGQILVYFQPKARLSDGVVVGAEALVRWAHPEHGTIPPDEFIPVAEQTELISYLTTHVLHESLRQCARWRAAGHALGVAVNLSVRSLLDGDLPGEVAGMLAHADLPAGALTLEITESSVMADPVRTREVLERLATMGVLLSVDDFGTGYSSLTYLRRLPVHEVKIDKSFVFNVAADAGDASIVQSIIELGHNLGLSVVAEGVEEDPAWDRLVGLGCDVAQGYLLSRPVPASVLTEWLDARRADSVARAGPGCRRRDGAAVRPPVGSVPVGSSPG